MRLIDADALINTLNEEKIKFNADINYIILNAPTVEAEHVVRCKDCKHNWVTSYNHGVQDEPRCKFTNYKFGLDDYCSRGERREE